MKLKNLLYLLLAAPLFVACDPVEEALDPVLTLTSEAEVNFTAEGGEGVITYTLENPAEGTKLEASCEADWVSNVTAGDSVTYTVAANEGEARETKVVVAYGAQSFEVDVKQAAKEATEPEPEPEPDGVVFVAYHIDGEYYGTSYGTTHNYYILISDNGVDEDGYMLPASTYYTLDLYGVEGVADEEGYITVPAGTYTLDADDSMEEGTIGASYSSYKVMNADGTDFDALGLFSEATLVVSENGLVLTAVVDGVNHTVNYEGAVKVINTTLGGGDVPTDGELIEKEVSYAYGYYYGDQYTPGLANNFYFYLSDMGIDEDGFDIPGGSYYRFDIYAPITDMADGLAVPVGTYRLDVNDSCEPWTVGAFYSAYYKMNATGDDYAEADWPTDGYITFNEDGTIEAEYLLMTTGNTHKLTFKGSDIVLYDISSGGSGDDDWGDEEWEGPYSTLTDNYTCDLSDHILVYAYYGDYYEVGYRNWMLALMPSSGEGDFIQFDILGDENSITSFGGNYNVEDSFGAFTAYPGYIDDGYMSGSWYYTSDGYTMAPFVNGTVNVVDGGDGTASLEFSAYDDLGNLISGSWSGNTFAYEEPSYSAPKLAAQKPAKAQQIKVHTEKKERLEFKTSTPAVKKNFSIRK